MTAAELIAKLADVPGDAEVVVVFEGDPDVGIWKRSATLTGAVVDDRHAFLPEQEPTPYSDGSGFVTCCEICGIIESAHAETPVLVMLEGDE